MGKIIEISAEGKPFHIGKVYGERSRELISKNIETYKTIFLHKYGLEWKKLVEKAYKSMEEISSFNADAIEFMKGIADGSGISFNDILVLNYRYEIIFSERSSCTSIGFLNGENTFIAQNWDLYAGIEDNTVNLRYRISGGPTVFTQVEAGALTHRGLNSEGIGLCINALRSKEDGGKLKVPAITVLGWSILNCRKFSKIFDLVKDVKRNSSINFLLAKKDFIVDLELTPKDFEYIEVDDNGIVVHTNHFISYRFKELNADLKGLSGDTFVREIRAKQLIRKLNHSLNIENVKEIFRDHFDYPSSICRHIDETVDQDSISKIKTLGSTILETCKNICHYTIGNPCKSDYITSKTF
ncbi:MAG: C45 family peptidase [Nitrososphaeria archaeon]|nr:C45 family peptidase [Nitrososphaeria archaeon]